MSDPRTYQRTGACFSHESTERQDAEHQSDDDDDTANFPPQVEMWYREELANTPDDTELIRRWFQHQKYDKRGCLLVVVVSEVFEVGSTAATEICRRHGFGREACTMLVKRQ